MYPDLCGPPNKFYTDSTNQNPHLVASSVWFPAVMLMDGNGTFT